MLVASTHAHGGAAGAGNDELAGVDSIAFDDLAASPDAAGELQRNGVNLEWYGAAVVKFTEADAAAATASPRTLGTGALQAAVGSHTHSIAASQHLKAEETFGAVSIDMATQAALSTFPKTLASQAITVGGSGKRALVYSGCVSIDNSNTAGITYTLAIKRDGVTKATIDSSSMGIGAKEIVSVSGLEADVANGSYTITLVLSASSAGGGEIANWTGGVLFISEGQVN